MFIQIDDFDFIAIETISRFLMVKRGDIRRLLIYFKNKPSTVLEVEPQYQENVFSVLKSRVLTPAVKPPSGLIG